MDAARRADSVYRWRGDGLTHEAEPIDYLHGESVAGEQWNAGGDRGEERGEGQRPTADGRLMHWDLLDHTDVHARTA